MTSEVLFRIYLAPDPDEAVDQNDIVVILDTDSDTMTIETRGPDGGSEVSFSLEYVSLMTRAMSQLQNSRALIEQNVAPAFTED